MKLPRLREAVPGLSSRAAWAFVALAILLSLFQLYAAGVKPVGLFTLRGGHLALVELLAFLLFPFPGRHKAGWSRLRGWLVDGAWMTTSLVTCMYLVANLSAIVDRAGAWTPLDLLLGVAAVATLLEASRRVLGWGITLVGAGGLAYAYLGPWLPGALGHGGYSTGRIVGQLYLGQEGIYGIPLGVAAGFVFVFILFGALLEASGGGRFFIDLAYATTGRFRGGPAKAAVLASAALGSVSGSAIANVVTSGAFTIPLMKEAGYSGEEAGGVEAAASTGGQVLPPIMGAGAFLIAEYTGLPYLEVVRASLLPALLYLATVFLFVHLAAVRRDLKGLPAALLPAVGKTLVGGWHFLLAVVVLIWALLLDVSVARVGFLGCLAVVVLATARGGVARGAYAVLEAFVLAGRNTLAVSLACAVAGILVGVVGLTGLGLKLSGLLLAFSQGNLLVVLLLILVASLVLGMGLPVTASYVVLIVLAGPVLVNDFGLPLLVAHLVVFWYSQDSNVTPPVCLAAYAAAGIAGSRPLLTGLHAWKYAKGLYLIPLYMVVHPEIVLGGEWAMVAVKAVVAMAGLTAAAGALEGFLIRKLSPLRRVLLLLAALLTFHPSLSVALVGPLLLLALMLQRRSTTNEWDASAISRG
ncbi:MAG: TRAP transporter fused permease subunit [Gemmatimonadota bacterium]